MTHFRNNYMENVKTKSNIFRYAISELSQDTFICWAVDGLNYPKSRINRFSKAFLVS